MGYGRLVIAAFSLLAVAGCDGLDQGADYEGPVTRTASSSASASESPMTSSPQRPKGDEPSDGSTPRPGWGGSGSDLPGDWEELGHRGFLELHLGMSRDEALRTGRIRLGETVGDCTGFYLAMYGDATPGPHGYFTEGAGLSAIRARDRMHTPEGIDLESSLGNVQDAYAHLGETPEFMKATVTDENFYFFTFEENKVHAFGLALPQDRCLTRWLR